MGENPIQSQYREKLWQKCTLNILLFSSTPSNKHKLGSFPLETGQYSVLCEGQIM